MSGSFAAIFSLDGSKKWIIREGVTGISSSGSGAPDGERLGEVTGVAHGRDAYRDRRVMGSRVLHEPPT